MTPYLLCVTDRAAEGPLNRFGLWRRVTDRWPPDGAPQPAGAYQAAQLIERFDRLTLEVAHHADETPEPAFAWATLILYGFVRLTQASSSTTGGASLDAAISYLDDNYFRPVHVEACARRAACLTAVSAWPSVGAWV